MAEPDTNFLASIAGIFQRVSVTVEDISVLVKGKNKAGADVPSPLLNVIAATERKQTELAAQIEAMQHQASPIENQQKRNISDALRAFEGSTTRIKEGLEWAVDVQQLPLSPFAWLVFLAGVAVLLSVLIYYIHLHAQPPHSTLLPGLSDDQRLAAVDTLAAIRVQAHLLETLLSQERALQDDTDAPRKETLASFRNTIQEALQQPVAILSMVTRLSAEAESLYNELKNEVNPRDLNNNGLEASRLNGKAIEIYSMQIGKVLRDVNAPYFWDQGAGRYAEVLFASFFGVMVFALYNWWKHMRGPSRGWWLGWYVAKIFLALMVSFTFVAILSQVNFTTPLSLQTQPFQHVPLLG